MGLISHLPIRRELGRRGRVPGSRRLHPLQLDSEAGVLDKRPGASATRHPKSGQVSGARGRRRPGFAASQVRLSDQGHQQLFVSLAGPNYSVSGTSVSQRFDRC